MQVIWKGSPNKDGQDYRETIDRVILHWFGIGTLDSANTRFQNPGTMVSAHYGISGDTVYQWVKEEEVAWHAGNYPMNQRSIGIEHDATTTQNASEQTYQTAGQLLAEVCARHSIPLDREHILKHSEVSATACPGTLDIDRIIELAKGGNVNEDIPTIIEEKYGLKDISRYNKYWTYEDLISDWVKLYEDKEDYKDEAEQYEDTCTSQAGQITILGEQIKTLNTNLEESKALTLQLQGQFAEVSRDRDVLADVCKGYENTILKLKLDNEALQAKLTATNPITKYTVKELVNEIIDRIFRR